MVKDEIQIVLESADDIVYSAMDKSPEKWRETLHALIRKLESLHRTYPDNAMICYALGYCWFHMPGVEVADFEQAKYWLEQSLALDPEHHYTTFYLGALFFEYRKYWEAKSYLSQVPEGYFEQHSQKWSDLKRAELLLCCDLYLNPDHIRMDHVTKVIHSYLEEPTEDWALPIELIECVVEQMSKYPNIQMRELAREIVQFIHAFGVSKPFAKELEILEEAIRCQK